MHLRGITLKGKPYLVSLKDCPIILNSKTVALINKPFSPLLMADSIVLGNEKTGLFEGDFVFDSKTHKLLGNIIYDKGFKILLLDSDKIINVDTIGPFYTMVNSDKMGIKRLADIKSDLRFKADDFTFTIDKLVRVDNGNVTIYSQLLRKIPVDDVKICTGIYIDKNPVAYGDILQGGIVECYNNLPMIKMANGKYKEIEQ